VPCKLRPVPPTNCTSGYSVYDGLEGCTRYVCNENLDDVQNADAQTLALWKSQRTLQFLMGTENYSF
jgi:hypothetical protein